LIKHIFIKNYALIESLDIDFSEGYSAVTGETGAGKSILLGALSLILGNRADTNILRNKDEKCIVEAHFDIQRYSLKVLYDLHDIDYDEITVIRREVSPNGRSRAFINDTPVNLNILKELSGQLTDIHSQHQNLNLNNHIFQLNVLDSFSRLGKDLSEYRETFISFKKAKNALEELIQKAENEKKDIEYLQFKFDELEEAKLNKGEQELAENELQQLNHTEEIKLNLSSVFELLSNEENGINLQLSNSLSALNSIKKFYAESEDYIKRLESVKIELDDISSSIEIAAEDIEFNPERAEFLKDRLDLIYSLQSKHSVSSVEDLIKIKQNIENRLSDITSFDLQIKKAKQLSDHLFSELTDKAKNISNIRKNNKALLEQEITAVLTKLAMPNAEFVIELKQNESFNEYGMDTVSFLFSGNKNVSPEEISEIASGGEISRLMLSIKSVISDSMALPAIIFDEIDTGVSGEVAEKIGIIMKEMSAHMQVINITHLPQVAAKAHNHYKVYKAESEASTITKIKRLDFEGRKIELASMLSGENITDAAVKNAEELLK